jgi:hypothetical protein
MLAMGRLTVLAVLIAGCGFHSRGSGEPPGPPGGDASVGTCAGFLDLCGQAEPSTMFELGDGLMIHTDSDPRCQALPQAGGGDVCLIYATAVVIDRNATLTAIGPRPLAIASISTLTLEGAIDVSSHGPQQGAGADATGCSFAGAPGTDAGGGGGGAGGSLTLPGGDGGSGDKNNNGGASGVAPPGKHGTTTTISALRGGCPGQAGGDEGGGPGTGRGGEGGHSGGALYLFARESIVISGTIRATGGGGVGGGGMAGGGGGGTGGLIVIESPSIMSSGRISANGGGGGQGGGFTEEGFFPSQMRASGNPGHDGDLVTTAAAGGAGAAGNDPGFGPGGDGGASGTAATSGTTADFGGGGGGGAAGVVIIRSRQPQLSGVISPMQMP